MRHHAHGDKHDQDVDENGSIGQNPEFLERTDLTDEIAAKGPNKTADGVAEFELGDLRNGLAVADDYVTNTEEQLKTLQEVDDVARSSSVNAVRKIGVILAGEFVGIKAEEACPQEPAGTSEQCQEGMCL